METPRKFIGVSTKLNKYIVFTMQTYKKLTFSYVCEIDLIISVTIKFREYLFCNIDIDM